jgi:hypothetical protein
MAATKTTRNKLNRARKMVYWLAQDQKHCHWCGKPLVNCRLSSVDNLTIDHISGSYDHVKQRERKRNGKRGVRLMHRSCHKSMTMRQNEVWKNRTNGKIHHQQLD